MKDHDVLTLPMTLSGESLKCFKQYLKLKIFGNKYFFAQT